MLNHQYHFVMNWKVKNRGRSAPDEPVLDKQEPPIGAHLISSRGLYMHHGICVGEGRVIHYAGLSSGLRRGPVEEVSLEEFARGHVVLVRPDIPLFERNEVVRRAQIRLGESQYRLLTNNCIHFCKWCLFGSKREDPTLNATPWSR
jgi:hypothetical protein